MTLACDVQEAGFAEVEGQTVFHAPSVDALESPFKLRGVLAHMIAYRDQIAIVRVPPDLCVHVVVERSHEQHEQYGRDGQALRQAASHWLHTVHVVVEVGFGFAALEEGRHPRTHVEWPPLVQKSLYHPVWLYRIKCALHIERQHGYIHLELKVTFNEVDQAQIEVGDTSSRNSASKVVSNDFFVDGEQRQPARDDALQTLLQGRVERDHIARH